MKKLFFVLVIIILAGFGLWFGLRQDKTSQGVEDKNATVITKKDGITVTKTNVAKSGGTRTPQGLPKDIPVESVSITESYKAYYENIQATQYTVSYTSERNDEVIWETYSDFMNSSGYIINKAVSSRSSGKISGYKGDDSLSVIITTHNGVSFVQLSYLDR